MADFCAQCAGDAFPSDFAGLDLEGIPVLCEGCGPTYVDADGRCISDCWERHATISVPPPPSDHRFYYVVGTDAKCDCAICVQPPKSSPTSSPPETK